VFPGNGALIVLCILSLPWLDSSPVSAKAVANLEASLARASLRLDDR